MEQCCFNHVCTLSEHTCIRCGHGFCIDCLTVVDHQPMCLKCAQRPRIPSEREVIAKIVLSSIALAVAVALYMGGMAATTHAFGG